MTKSQLIIANMLKKAGRKVSVINTAKTLSPAQIADEQERERQETPSSTRRVPVENIGGKIAGALPPVIDAKSAGDRLRAEYETFKPWFNSVPLPPPRDVLERYLACLEATQ